jgi:hypothetical protein
VKKATIICLAAVLILVFRFIALRLHYSDQSRNAEHFGESHVSKVEAVRAQTGSSGQEAAAIRFAFLSDPVALSDTVDFLRNAGCEQEALSNFKSLASNRTARISIDTRTFPNAVDGFYVFTNLAGLLEAVSTNDLTAGAAADFNCFDTAILLTGNKLATTVKPDDLAGPFLVWHFSTNSDSRPWVTSAATARDAFVGNYSVNSQKSSDGFPEGMRDSHICLTAVLFGLYALPFSSATNYSEAVHQVLNASWRRNGVRFPKSPEVLLLHRGEGLTLRTSHAGVIFPHGHKFTYVEKIGWSGPFVRLDVEDKADILRWVGSLYHGTNTSERLFVTVNEQICELHDGTPQNPNESKTTGN